MKRLSLAELKAQSGNVVENLETVKGGNADMCHCTMCEWSLKDWIRVLTRTASDF